MTRWIRGPELRPTRGQEPFDPVVEGARYQLTPERALAIWRSACADALAREGWLDPACAQQAFHDLAARGGARVPGVGKLTATGLEDGLYDDEQVDLAFAGQAPGRLSQVTVEQLRRTNHAVSGIPGRLTRVTAEADRRALPGSEPVTTAEGVHAPAPQERSPERTSGVPASSPASPGRARFDEFLAIGFSRALHAALQRGGRLLFEATLGFATTGVARATTPAVGPGAGGNPSGRAMWRAAERHAATLYRRAMDAGEVTREDPAVEAALQRCGAGDPLPAAVQRAMEAQLGVPLDRVRIHSDHIAAEAARAVSAEAFTLGEDIFFAEGAYAPETRAGQQLLAHELTHVVQAQQGRTGRDGGVSKPGDTLEREAETMAERVARGAPARGEAGTGAPAARGDAGTGAPAPHGDAGTGAPARGAEPPRVPPATPVHSQPLLRKPANNRSAREHIPAIKGGAKRTAPQARAAIASPSSEFASRAQRATSHAAETFKHGVAHAKANPPGKAPHDHAKAARKTSKEAERAARAAEHDHHRATEDAHAPHAPAAHGAPGPAQAASGVHGAIKLKPISDWTKFMPEPLPDQDDRERARIQRLVRGKIEGDRATAAAAFDKLRSAHLRQAAAVRASKPGLEAQISASQHQALGHVAASERAQSSAVHRSIARVQGQVTGHAAAEKAKVAAAHAAAIVKINAAYDAATRLVAEQSTTATASVAAAETFALITLGLSFVKLRSDFVKLGSKKAGDALAVGEDQASAMGGQWDGDKLEAAQKAARDTADGFATQMPDQAMATYAQVEQNRPAAEQSLHDLATATRTNVDLIRTNTQKALDAIKGSAIQSADTAKTAALAEIDQACASTVAGLAAQGAAQVAAIRQQSGAARARITAAGAAARTAAAQLAEQTASGLEGGAAGIVRGAAQIEAPDLDDVARSVRKGEADLAKGATGLTGGLAATASASSESLTEQASAAAEGMVGIARSAQAQATQTGAGATQQISNIAHGAIQSLGQIPGSTKTTIDKTTADSQTAFTKQTTDLGTAYARAATDRETEFAGSLSQCEGQLDGTVPRMGGGRGGAGSGKKSEEGGGGGGGGPAGEVAAIQEAAKKAADAVKPWWQKALAVVAAVVVSIVVVIVVTALVATTGPVGMILVGAAAGALSTVAGTMASNLVLGNKLFEGVTWKSVLIGALGGALCAGATAGMGAAAKALAGSTRLAASTGTAARGLSVAAKALDTSEGVVGGFQAGAIRYGANLITNFAGSELATFAVEHKLDLSLETLMLTVAMNKLPGKLEHFQAKVQAKIQSKIPFGFQVKQTTFGNPAKVRDTAGAGGGEPAAPAAPGGKHEPAAAHGAGSTPAAPHPAEPGKAGAPPTTGHDAPAGPGASTHGGSPAAPAAHDPAPAPHGNGKSEPAPSGDAGPVKTAPGKEPGAPAHPGDGPGKPVEAKPGEPGAEPRPGETKSGEPGAEPRSGESRPGEPGAIEPRPGEVKPGEPGATQITPGEPGGEHAAKPGDAKGKPGDASHPGEPTHGEASQAGGEHAAKPGDEHATAPGGASEPGRPGESQQAHDETRDRAMTEDGYPEGTRAKADDTAAKVERGEKPSRDGLRDTEANARGRKELERMLEDPKLSPEDRARIEKLLADKLRAKGDPTGALDRDLAEVKAKLKAEHDAKAGERDASRPGERSGEHPGSQVGPEIDPKSTSRDTRGFSESHAGPTDPHLELLEKGRSAMERAAEGGESLAELVHPELTASQKKALEVIDSLADDVAAKLSDPKLYKPYDAAKHQALEDQAVRLQKSRENLSRGFEADRQKRASANADRALRAMENLRDQLLGPEAPARHAADQIEITPEATRGSSRTERELRDTIADFIRLTGEEPRVTLDYSGDRGHYNANTRTVNVGRGKPSTILHELAHGLEYDHPDIAAASKAFREARGRRAGGGNDPEPVPLNQLEPGGNYKPGEVAIEGDFASKYSGKVYPDAATEILTTGLQRFTNPKDMLALYRQDPEHFEFIVGVLEKLKGHNALARPGTSPHEGSPAAPPAHEPSPAPRGGKSEPALSGDTGPAPHGNDRFAERSLAEIREGIPRHVRSEAELSNADVVRSLKDQLQEIKPAEIDDILGRFPPADQARARQVLARSSGYGEMESLNGLRAAAEPYLAGGAELYAPGQGSLADNLSYLATEKKVFRDTPEPITTTREIKPGTVVILDDVVLAKIKADPEFARSLRDNGAVLLDPRGFTEGNNMFNAGTPDAVASRTARLVERATEIQARSGGKMTFDDAITQALDQPALDILRAADPTLADQRHVVDPASRAGTSSEEIAAQLNGDAGINEAQLEAALAKVPEADRGYLRELLAQQGEVFSPRRIANSLKAQHEKIMQFAADRGIAPDKVYYFILEPSKSYDMVAMAHRAVTGTPVDHYISGADALAGRHLGDDTMLVILDDVAGSGNSLKNKASPAAAGTGYPGEIVVSPVVSTTDAVSLFEGKRRPGSKIDPGPPAPYLPEKVILSLRSSPFYQSLPEADQAELEALIGHLGFDENGLSMAFPYMAPNNNNLFFSDQIAQWFIMNDTRAASKVMKGADQTWDPDRQEP